MHAHALAQPGTGAPDKAAYLAMWNQQLMAVSHWLTVRRWQQPQPQRQQERQKQSQPQLALAGFYVSSAISLFDLSRSRC